MFARKQTPTPATATTTPPAAGPTTRAALNRLELRATAFGSSSRPTISNVSAWRAGASSTSTVPRRPASSSTCQAVTTPTSVSNVRMAAIAIETTCVQITARRASRRSTTTPANTVNGRNWQSASRPTATGECVSSSISQAVAMFCIQVPLTEITWPEKNSR